MYGTEDRRHKLEEELKTLPKGSITHKNINGTVRVYLQWRDENGKTRSRYLKKGEEEEYLRKIERRRAIEKELRSPDIRHYVSEGSDPGGFETSVTAGYQLTYACGSVRKLLRRECFSLLENYLNSDTPGKVCILFGLRRTGKTTLLFQAISDLPEDRTAYIKIKSTDSMSMLSKDLERLSGSGFRYVFIDEITLMEDFIGTAALLSDIYAYRGMKLVLSGTDSLGFTLASSDELYDRCVMIHTSFIPFREYSRLIGMDSVDSYIEYGGTLRRENMGFDDPDMTDDSVSFRDDESTRKYIDTSISRNIQHTLKNEAMGSRFCHLRDLYEKNELTNVINRVVESMNHEFVVSTVKARFRSHDPGSAKQLLLHEAPLDRAYALYDIDAEKVTERLKKIAEIKELEETSVQITDDAMKQIRTYLFRLDLIKEIEVRYDELSPAKYAVFTQPGMRYSIAKALVYALMKDSCFSALGFDDREYIKNRILEDVKGRMLEDIILLETSVSLRKYEVFKMIFSEGGEYDMVIADPVNGGCEIYEIKHSAKTDPGQYRHLTDEKKAHIVAHRYGGIKGRYVIYRGEEKTVDGIKYLNAENYLRNIAVNR